MDNELWRWADPNGQQRRVRLDELRAALAGGLIAPNTPVWRSGWRLWQPAHEVPELTTSALSAANGVVPNIPPPPLAVVAVQHEYERASAPPPPGEEEPPPPPYYVPFPVKSSPISQMPQAPSSSGALPTSVGLPPPTFAPAPFPTTPSAAPSPRIGASAFPAPFAPTPSAAPQHRGGAGPTVLGVPPPTHLEEMSGSMLLDASSVTAAPSPRSLPPGTPAALVGTPILSYVAGMPPPTEPILHSGIRSDEPPPPPDPLAQDLSALNQFKAPKNKLLIGVVVAVAGALSIVVIATIITVTRKKSAAAAASASAVASVEPRPSLAPPSPSPSPSPSPVASSSPVILPPLELGGDCTTAGDVRELLPRISPPSGVEATVTDGTIALGFVLGGRETVATTIDAAGALGPLVKVRVPTEPRRVVPSLTDGAVAPLADLDRKNDRIAARHVVAANPAIDIGIADGALVWAPHGKDSFARLFALEGEGVVEGLRGVPLEGAKGIALTFRRGSVIYAGLATGEGALASEGGLARLGGGPPVQVSLPSVTASGDAIVVAWSERAPGKSPWQVKSAALASGRSATPARTLATADGNALVWATSVSGLGGGRFLAAWSEGMPMHQHVRGVTANADGAPSGTPFELSAPNVNSGQPIAAVGPDGKGVVAFLGAKGKSYALVAVPVTCAK